MLVLTPVRLALNANGRVLGLSGIGWGWRHGLIEVSGHCQSAADQPDQLNWLRNLDTLMAISSGAITTRARAWGQRASRPTPFSSSPRRMAM